MDKIAKGKSTQQMQMQSEEDPIEAASRKDADFGTIENQLNVKRFPFPESLDISGFLGGHNPFAKKANPKENIVWYVQ